MHLTKRRSGDGFSIEFRIDAVDRCTEVILDAGHGEVAIEARKLILELGQFLEQHRRNDVWTGGKGLASFDESRTEINEQIGTFPGSRSGALLIAEQP